MFPRAGLAAGVISCFLASTISADPKITKGTRELSLHVSPDFESTIGDMILVQAGYGVFLRDRLELRGTFNYALLEDIAGADADYKMFEYGVVGEYHIDLGGAAVPYLGAGIGWGKSEFGSLDESALVYGPRAGVKYFVADNVAIDFEVAYKLAFADVFINDFIAEDHDLSLGLGLRVLF